MLSKGATKQAIKSGSPLCEKREKGAIQKNWVVLTNVFETLNHWFKKIIPTRIR